DYFCAAWDNSLTSGLF
nr:immunoglobulin light chain junction region [Macaca mulatta]MOW57871.1 immunoglobulin light chain junction region [Macaca mulatta]MOW58386.1 immunoglobulin light chain junction region [Macaca mulatta]MOW59494.1 immunoglobulin light chain junction region [Macaca mulatta]MOW60913.1 immunoglobulin light chain junction region [Macaca mulatta]